MAADQGLWPAEDFSADDGAAEPSWRPDAVSAIKVGTASWTDKTLLDSGWYPPTANTPEKRLAFYARQFPLVEVDATYYVPPAELTARPEDHGATDAGSVPPPVGVMSSTPVPKGAPMLRRLAAAVLATRPLRWP
jgi:hypothetical protein